MFKNIEKKDYDPLLRFCQQRELKVKNLAKEEDRSDAGAGRLEAVDFEGGDSGDDSDFEAGGDESSSDDDGDGDYSGDESSEDDAPKKKKQKKSR
jgi:hypothetical protein